MKIVFFGYDFSLPTLHRLVKDGHEPIAIVSFETDNIFSFNANVEHVATQLEIDFHVGPLNPAQMDGYIAKGAEIFVSTGYPHKIPVVDENKAYAVNLHPTLLPEGRGIMPMPTLFLEHPEFSGITIHKISEGFDEGDILLQEKLPINPVDDIETLSARMAMKSPEMMSKVLGNIEEYWANARPQTGAGSWWKAPDEKARTFDWNNSVAQTDKMLKAFGRYGMMAEFDEQRWAVFEAKVWMEDHNHAPGTVVLRLSREYVIALPDGYVILKKFQPIED